MDIALPILAVLFAWRFLACLAIAIFLAVPLGQHLGPIAGFSVALIGVGFGCIWQGRWLSGISLFTSVASPPISKPVAFICLALIGAIWGGFASEVMGSLLGGVLALVAVVTLVGAWLALALKRHGQLNNLVFSAFSLLSGLGGLYALSVFRL